MKKSCMLFCAIVSILICSSDPLFAVVNVLFSGYSNYHIQYTETHYPSGDPLVASEELQLICDDGNGNETIVDSGATIISSDKKEVLVSDPGATVSFIVRVKITSTGGGISYSQISSTEVKSNEINGSPQFSCVINPDPANQTVLDFVSLIGIPENINLTIKNVKANDNGGTVAKTYFRLDGGSNLVIENCEFLGFDASGGAMGNGSVKATNCIFTGITLETNCLMTLLASVEIQKCRFDGSCSLGGGWDTDQQDGAVTVSDSLFLCEYAKPEFNGTTSINVNTSEFYNEAIVTAQTGAPVDFSNCVFKSDLNISTKTGPGAINVKNCHFWGKDGLLFIGQGLINANSCYWGCDDGPVLNTVQQVDPGWLRNSGTSAACAGGTITITNSLCKSDAVEKVCSRTEPRGLPGVWLTEKVIGQNILLPVPYKSKDAEFLMRKGRDTMLAFDVKAGTTSLNGAKFYLEWNGEKINPVNPNMTLMRDYGDYGLGGRESSERPDERTVNFIIPANKTNVDANTVVKFFSDTSSVAGYAKPGPSSKELCNFYVTFKEPFARKLRIAVIPVNAYKISNFFTNYVINPTDKAMFRRVIQNIMPSMFPLRPDEIEVIVTAPYCHYTIVGNCPLLGGDLSSKLIRADMKILKALINSNFSNFSNGGNVFDYIVAVVPDGTIGTESGNSADGIGIIKDIYPLTTIHEFGHHLGMYNGREQYDYPAGTAKDEYGNIVSNTAGESYIPVHNLTAFKPDESFIVHKKYFQERYRHIPFMRLSIFDDFMGTGVKNFNMTATDEYELSSWIVKSSLKQVYDGLYKLLGQVPPMPKPLPADKNRILFHGFVENSELFGNSVLCRNASELPNVVSDPTTTLANTFTAYDASGTKVLEEPCVHKNSAAKAPDLWIQTFDVPKTAVKYEIKNASGTVFNLENPGQTISNDLTAQTNTSDGTLKISFSGSALKNSTKTASGTIPLRHQLYCSTDKGTTWLPLTAMLTKDGGIEIALSSLPSCDDLQVKLVSSDGFSITEKIVAGVKIDRQNPSVKINSPVSGDSAQPGYSWNFSAFACDGDGNLIETGTWSSSKDGNLGTGLSLSGVVLSDGTHDITFSVTDSTGMTGQQKITVNVAAMSTIDLSIDKNALSFRTIGQDPVADSGNSPKIGTENKVALTVRNQGIANQANLILYVTPPGGTETKLAEQALDWNPFDSYPLSAIYTPPSTGTYVFRATLNPININDSNTANNECTWTFSNNAPVAFNIDYTILDAGAQTLYIDGEDDDGDALTFSITQQPAHGTATLDGDTVTYTPSIAPGITSDTFKYKANDGTVDSNEATVTMEFQFDVPSTADMTMAASPANGGTTTPVAGATNTVNTNEAQNIMATSADGFVFTSWTSNPEGIAVFANASSANTTATLYGDATITANFSSTTATYNLTMAVAPADSGTTDPAVGIHPVNIGIAQSITATASTGYAFTGWTADANAVFGNANSASTKVVLNGDATVTANFAATQATAQLTVQASPAQGGTTSPSGTSVVNTGEAQDITATASEGYYFVNWSANSAGAVLPYPSSAETTITLNSDTVATANFAELPDETSMAYGKAYVAESSPAGLADFAKAPKVYAQYVDPLKGGKAKKASLKVLDKINKGVYPTFVKCEWKGRITLFDKKLWDKTLTCEENLSELGDMEPLSTDIFVVGVDSTGKKVNQDTQIDLILVPPEITGVYDLNGEEIFSASAGKMLGGMLKIKGTFFGSAPPMVWMEYSAYDKDGNIKEIRALKLKVSKKLKYMDAKGMPAKSCMDVETGLSEISVFVPEKWPKDWDYSEYHNIVIDNKVGRATIQFQTEE